MTADKKLRLLLTNDDGYGEPGLEALHRAAEGFGNQVTIAPQQPYSCCGHQVTLCRPLLAVEKSQGSFALDGSPADCVRLGIKQIAPDVDWVFTGINPGANLGSDIYQSGTVAAAREAAILGVKSIAFSCYIAREETINWPIVTKVTAEILPQLLAIPLPPGHYLNVNLPSPLTLEATNKVVFCNYDRHPHNYVYKRVGEQFLYQGVIHDRPYTKESDVDACFSGNISVTILKV